MNRKEKHFDRKTKNCLPRIKNTEAEKNISRICLKTPFKSLINCCNQQKVTELEITKMEVGNEMEAFIN